MPMLTAASDLFENRSQEWYDLPQWLRDVCEAASHLRDAHTMLDECESVSRREGRHDDGHDLRSPEQATYLAWQAAELAFQQITGRMVATRDAEPAPSDPLRERAGRGEYLSPTDFFGATLDAETGAITISEPAPAIDDPEQQLARVAHLSRPAGVSFGPIDPDFF